jgi:lysophospholipase L1-like esterase
VQRYVLDHHPDLLIITGISESGGVGSIRQVLEQVTAGGSPEVLLMTGALGSGWRPPRRPDRSDGPAKPPGFAGQLHDLAREYDAAFIDLCQLWNRYVFVTSGRPLEWFKRDVTHANVRGRQAIARLLERHFDPGAVRVAR